MPEPITMAVLAGAGIATSLIGASKERKARKKAARTERLILSTSNKKAAAQQSIADIQFDTETRIAGINQQQEASRREQTIFEAARQTRQVARELQLARSTAVAGASESGALASSSLQGVLGSQQAQAGEQATNINTNLGLALANFNANKSIFNTQSAGNRRISGVNRTIAGLDTRLRTLGVQANNAQSDAAVGRSLFNTGIQIAQSAPQASSVFTSLFNGSRTAT
jgi:hypothetical protein